jgi:hypothetical protein
VGATVTKHCRSSFSFSMLECWVDLTLSVHDTRVTWMPTGDHRLGSPEHRAFMLGAQLPAVSTVGGRPLSGPHTTRLLPPRPGGNQGSHACPKWTGGPQTVRSFPSPSVSLDTLRPWRAHDSMVATDSEARLCMRAWASCGTFLSPI